jgi:hypothetical protein
MVVAWMTHATAPQSNYTNQTQNPINMDTGLSLPRTGGAIDSAAGLNPSDSPREIGGRPQLTPINPQIYPTSSTPTNPTRDSTSQCKKRTKATLKIASLNMRGRGGDKWHCTSHRRTGHQSNLRPGELLFWRPPPSQPRHLN